MHIDRYNYEAFFLLYTDNELSAADRQAVEQFIQQNPDLKPELDMLQQYILMPDLEVVFSNKASLLQTNQDSNIIHQDNYTMYFLLYADNELSKPEKTAVEQFVHDHRQFREELELLCTVKLVPDTSLTFGDKKDLYRHEKNLPAIWRRVQLAAAAMLLFGAGALWQQLHRSPELQVPVAMKKVTPQANRQNAHPTGNVQTKMAGNHPSKAPLPLHEDIAATQHLSQKEPPAAMHGNLVTRRSGSANIHITHDAWAASNQRSINPSGISSNIIPAGPAGDLAASIGADAPATNRLIAGEGVMPGENKANSRAEEALLTSEGHDENVILVNIAVQRKNALRGLFRKASRFIDKTTALKTSRNPGIQIGNIEIAFQ